LLEAANRLKSMLILLDISLPPLNGLEAARHLKNTLPETKLLFLTMHASPRYATEAFKAGENAFLLKQSADSELLPEITTVSQGKHYLTPSITKPVITQALTAEETPTAKGDAKDLTSRQREILQLIGEEKDTKEIATILNVSVKTMQFHETCLIQTLTIHSTAELMRYGIAQGIATNCDRRIVVLPFPS